MPTENMVHMFGGTKKKSTLVDESIIWFPREDDGSPRQKILDHFCPDEVKQFFLRQVAACYGGSLASRVWRHSDALEVVSAEPFVTSSGKVLPLHLLRDTNREEKDATKTIS